MPRPARDVAGEAILSWLGNKTPAYLQDLAARRADLVPVLRQEFGGFTMAMARGMLAHQEKQALAGMTAQQADQVITLVLRHRPELGAVLWRHSDWAVGEIVRLARWFVGAAPAPATAIATRAVR